MSQERTVVLDSEAVAALHDPRHRKHRAALELVEAANARNRRGAGPVRVVVPTAVRVEAGWDRRAPAAARINRVRLVDIALDGAGADRAAAVRARLGVSVADAHLGAVVAGTTGPHAIVTSDVPNVQRIVDELGAAAVVVRI